MFDKLPLSIKVNNIDYKINTDFRYFIELENIIKKGADKQKIFEFMFKLVPFFYKIVELDLVEQAINEIIKFYLCGKEYEPNENSGSNACSNQIYDYEQDEQFIWGAYYTQYKIDLNTAKIHWWKFKSMWNCLDSELIFSKIRSYRAYNGKDKNLLELKQFYKLKESKENKERKKKIIEEILSQEKRC